MTKVRGKATLTLAVGASCLLFALWDVSDESFGRSRAGLFGHLVDLAPAWLFDTFGHWGPRVLLVAVGVLSVAASFRLASLPRESEAHDQRSETKRTAFLSWTLIVLILSLLALIGIGPLLQDPTIDQVLSYWREHYYAPAAGLALMVVLGLTLRWDWQAVRESGDLFSSEGMRILMYLAIAIILVLFILWKILVTA